MSTNHPANIDIAAALAEAQELYRARNPKSLAQYEEACAALPGGNTRSAIFVEPFPLTMARGEGSRLWDLDGHEYVDFLSEFTAGLFGHSHPLIRRAIDQALDGGVNLGAHGAAVAAHEHVYCKISGMVTEADWTSWTAADLTPYIDTVVEAFGTKRIMYGSDWPVCLVAASYAEMIQVVKDYFSSFPEEFAYCSLSMDYRQKKYFLFYETS